ncbi:sigma-54 dependent transcriptional regulator [Notoacmeibacter sp. MSK16QG-6]|uniref:sigma-54-dependent transcriptional regulator n=1 Tax=Notoacmeibacter sp. MSK16QG-6 TaxID=2957982 RepID=UPI0020A10E03|nr:sigma-54 dependent transcriptional regulator [Notoacmeibacter sp. MSK16QG-6]MCP1199624.1 sigma-54 dependent transcriptional regulator [Notoacmeibacter sp. MSK16QG-6]
MSQVILIDDDDDLRLSLSQGLELEGYEVLDFADPLEALESVTRRFEGIVVSDIRMPGMGGIDVLKAVLAIDPALPVILITGHGDVPLAVQAMRDGAYDFIEKPFPTLRLASVVRRALHMRRLALENRSLREHLESVSAVEERLVGRTPAMRHLRDEIAALADTDADVLVRGDTGTGKEVVARALHDSGSRSSGHFVAINCGALPADIIESELFGHEPGAFTGAKSKRVGKIEHANGGTVFLDEIESMPLDLQVKLLRVIEQRVVEPLGSNKVKPLDVRFVAASKADLAKESQAGRFRADLYYRLNVISLTIPSLKERKEDIPLLFHHLAREARARYRRDIPPMTPALEADLMGYDWPGNVRELRNVADRWVLGLWRGLSSAPQIEDGLTSSGHSLSDQLALYEKAIIEAELSRNEGRMKPTYEALGLSRKGLYDKIRRLGIAAHAETEGDDI